jgi:nitroreductase
MPAETPRQQAGQVPQLLRTTGSVRVFTDEPVDDATLHAVLDTARFAPSGGNRQPWRVAVIRDSSTRRALAELMQGVWDEYMAYNKAGLVPFATEVLDTAAIEHVPNGLLDAIDTIPVVLVVAADRSKIAVMDGGLDRPSLTGGASIYPFCWNLLLAAREHGLGGVMTTFLSRAESAAAPTLGLPDGHALAATMFLGHPEHQPTKLRRQQVESFTTLDRFDGEAFDPSR